MPVGAVKWFNVQRGYGFIQPDDGDKDVFFHVTALERAGITAVQEGQRLEYELSQQRDGRTAAVNLKPVD